MKSSNNFRDEEEQEAPIAPTSTIETIPLSEKPTDNNIEIEKK